MNKENSIPKFEGIEEVDNSLTVRDAYDIDVFDIYDELKKKYPNDGNVKILNELDNSTFFEMQEDNFVKSLKSGGIDLSKNQENRCCILPSTSNFYLYHLGWKILIIDPYKIEALLSYQSKEFLGNSSASKDNFVGLVEHVVYEFVKANNYLNESIRLKKIMKWVRRNHQTYQS
ncbi:MAG: hypothetical protein MUP22_00575 [Desulfobacterales bacterium]|nr:hypothetical protein [Desulfobacterales bacterium]